MSDIKPLQKDDFVRVYGDGHPDAKDPSYTSNEPDMRVTAAEKAKALKAWETLDADGDGQYIPDKDAEAWRRKNAKAKTAGDPATKHGIPEPQAKVLRDVARRLNPDRLYGGTQDNGTLWGPSRTGSQHGIQNRDWLVPYGADGYACRVDPEDPNVIYVTWQNGNLLRYDRRSRELVEIKPQPEPNDPPTQ